MFYWWTYSNLVLVWTFKSKYRRCSLKNIVLKELIFTGKHLCWSFFLIKLHAWRFEVCNLLKRDAVTGFSPVNIKKKKIKNSFFQRKPLVAASEVFIFKLLCGAFLKSTGQEMLTFHFTIGFIWATSSWLVLRALFRKKT